MQYMWCSQPAADRVDMTLTPPRRVLLHARGKQLNMSVGHKHVE